jgi:hypothetical protein
LEETEHEEMLIIREVTQGELLVLSPAWWLVPPCFFRLCADDDGDNTERLDRGTLR